MFHFLFLVKLPIMSSHDGQGRCDVPSGFNHRKSQKKADWTEMQMLSSIQEAQSLSHPQVEGTQLPPERGAEGGGDSTMSLL